jgi:hypothetical protein
MVNAGMNFDAGDLRSISRTLSEFQKVTKKSQKTAVKWGTFRVVSSLRASTKKGKKIRKVTIPKTKAEKGIKDKRGRKLFWGWSYNKNGNLSRFPIYEYSLARAKASNPAKIRRWGLAKLSWNWSLRDLFNKRVTRGDRSLRRPIDAVRTRKHDRTDNFGVVIVNQLRYIRKSFKTSGNMAASNAIRRAEKGMIKQIEKNLFKRA